jgi:cytochrome c oxidase cbb3-type subunit 2
MTDFRKLTLGIAASFGLPWLLLIVVPAFKYQHIKPIAYDKEADGMDGYYPQSNANVLGMQVYIREGCVQCHTQMIRPSQFAADAWHQGWGESQEARPADAIRANTMRDYLAEKVALLGVARVGPDLANAGYRLAGKDRAAIHLQLYLPHAVAGWSNMPAYPHLYVVRKAQGPKSDLALPLTGKFAPQKGYEVVPTPEAEELVDYLLSLKKATPLPAAALGNLATAAAK